MLQVSSDHTMTDKDDEGMLESDDDEVEGAPLLSRDMSPHVGWQHIADNQRQHISRSMSSIAPEALVIMRTRAVNRRVNLNVGKFAYMT